MDERLVQKVIQWNVEKSLNRNPHRTPTHDGGHTQLVQVLVRKNTPDYPQLTDTKKALLRELKDKEHRGYRGLSTRNRYEGGQVGGNGREVTSSFRKRFKKMK